MKIGIDVRLWHESGVGRYIRNLIRELSVLDKKNTYTLFVLPKDTAEISSAINQKQWRIVPVSIRWHSLQEQLLLPAMLQKAQVDLVHFPYFSVPILFSKPFVVTIHDLILHHFPTGQASTLPYGFYLLKHQGYKYVIKEAVKKAKKIMTVSHATADELVSHFGVAKDKIAVTYESVDQKIKKKEENKESLPYFLYVGNAYPHKNIERLITAFLDFAEQYPKTQLILVGREDYFYKRLKARFWSNPSIQFKGFVSDDKLAVLYQNATATICPSLMEGFGLTGLEAMANSCLVLASDIPAHREIYADAAEYFDPHTTKDITEKMKDICSNDRNHSSKLIKIGLERVKMFSWEKMARETLTVYESSASASSA